MNLLKLAGPARWPIVLATAVGLLVTACHVLQGVSLSVVLVALLKGSPLRAATVWLAVFAVLVAVRGALVWLAEIVAQDIAQRTKENLRQRLLAQLVELGPGPQPRRQTGDLQATLVAGVEALESYYSRYLPAIFVASFGCLGVLLCLAWVDWQSALLLAAFDAAFPVADHLWLRWRMPKASGVFAAMGTFGAYLLDSLQGIVTLKAFDAAGRRRTVVLDGGHIAGQGHHDELLARGCIYTALAASGETLQ